MLIDSPSLSGGSFIGLGLSPILDLPLTPVEGTTVNHNGQLKIYRSSAWELAFIGELYDFTITPDTILSNQLGGYIVSDSYPNNSSTTFSRAGFTFNAGTSITGFRVAVASGGNFVLQMAFAGWTISQSDIVSVTLDGVTYNVGAANFDRFFKGGSGATQYSLYEWLPESQSGPNASLWASMRNVGVPINCSIVFGG